MDIAKMRRCAALLPFPGPAAVAMLADEIELLRAENERQAREIKGLRDALTTIKDLPDLSGFGASHETIFQMRNIARAALKENNDVDR